MATPIIKSPILSKDLQPVLVILGVVAIVLIANKVLKK